MPEKRLFNCRIVVDSPLAGVTYAMQRGKTALHPPARSTPEALVFEFPLTLVDIDADPPRLTGEFAQGPADKRFVYVNTGTIAGQFASPWRRRAKVPLYGIQRAMLAELMAAQENLMLEARIHGVAKDGGPACATVPLLAAWSIVPGA
ncbi:MAG: DUF5990 family protein [Rhodothermales bacterium]